MSERREVWQTLAALLKRVEGQLAAEPSRLSLADGGLSALEQELRKLGKTQYKANILAEEQSTRLEKALAVALATQEQNAPLLHKLEEEIAAAARQDLLEAILPVLDGLENAIHSGQRYLEKRDMAARKLDLTPAQAVLVSPADRAMLAGWLDGLRLLRERLLTLLEAGGVAPIPSVGHPFDPYLHVAVGAVDRAPEGMTAIPGIIVAEERVGYQSPAGVIRYADVIVYRPDK